jgi:hypothetical protein
MVSEDRMSEAGVQQVRPPVPGAPDRGFKSAPPADYRPPAPVRVPPPPSRQASARQSSEWQGR